jgi:carboxymethylenebutenolidase
MSTDQIVTESPILAEEAGRRFDGYLARPHAGSGPGLIIITEMWGITELNRDMAESYARRGWCALVPSMFWRSQRTGTLAAEGPEREAAWERLRAYDFDRGAHDAKTAADWLRGSPFCSGKVAVIGFCMGGRTASLACARAGVDAAIAVYALGIRHHLDEVARVTCPLQLHYRATWETLDRGLARSRAQGLPSLTGQPRAPAALPALSWMQSRPRLLR